jgi:hypothetical protein
MGRRRPGKAASVPRDPDEPDALDEPAEERNADPVTQREALELDLMDEGRSEDGERIGDEID